MKILVIGASGHVGAYLVNELVHAGHDVDAVMRGIKKPYGYDENVWSKVNVMHFDRNALLASDVIERGNYDVICDLIAFELDSVKTLVSKIKNDAFYLLIGSIWTYENKMYVPVDENHPKNSVQTYGREKGKMEEYLLSLSQTGKLRCCIVHPGHVSGKEWMPISPQGNLDVSVFDRLKKGEEVVLPFLGLPTIQHVHAQDLAKVLTACIENQDKANGEAFIAVAEHCMTLRAICEELYAYYNQTPNLRYVEWAEFERIVGKENADVAMDHIGHSPCCTMEKAKRVLGVQMQYSIMDIYKEYLEYQKMN